MTARKGRLIRLVRAQPRLFVVTAVALAVGLFLPATVTDVPVTRWLIAWNCGTLLYVLLGVSSFSVQ